MASLTPDDIALYVKCPKLYERKGQISKPLTFFESKLRETFIEGERNAVLKDSIIKPRKFTRAWNKLWFPAAIKRRISVKVATEKTLQATIKFADYCKYDISDYDYPTAGVDIQSSMIIGSHELIAQADILKIDLSTKKKTTVIINFSNKKLSLPELLFDPSARATAYSFYRGKGDYVTYINIDINERQEKLNITAVTFSPKEMDEIRKMIYHIELGIRNKAYYHNPNLCERCKACPVFKL